MLRLLLLYQLFLGLFFFFLSQRDVELEDLMLWFDDNEFQTSCFSLVLLHM